jgi:L-ectoine synthase
VLFRDRADLVGTARDVVNSSYRSTRLLLRDDGAGVGLHDVVMHPGVDEVYGYPDRTEISYCLDGAATVTDLDTRQTQRVVPGVLWVAPPGSRFTVDVEAPLRLICVFHPPLEGTETGILPQ